MYQNKIKTQLESKIGPVTFEELEFAIEQFEINCDIAKRDKRERRLHDETFYDMLAANVDFRRREKSSFTK